jgi:hypothetical protein
MELNWKIFLNDNCQNDILNIEKIYGIKRCEVYEITKIYGNYISNLTNYDDIEKLSAHCYVRHMVDLMAGFIIKKT